MIEYTLSEAGVKIGRASTTLRNQVHRGKLKARLVGKTYVVTQKELDRYVRDNRRAD